MSLPKLQYREPDRWIELVKLFIILAAAMAVRNSFGIFFTSLENQFGLSRGETSAFFSVFMILAAFFTILSGWALDRFGPKLVFIVMGFLVILSQVLTGQATSSWQLFFSYSLLLAAGTGGAFSLTLATISRLFVKRRGLALGIGLSGEGAGTLAVAPLATYLIASFSWRIAFMVVGLIFGAIMIGLALSLNKLPRHSGPAVKTNSATSSQVPGFSVTEALKTRSFWFLGAVYLLFSLSYHLVLTHAVPNAIDLGIDAAKAAIIISLMGASTIPGRLVIGWLSDKTNRKMLAIYCTLIQVAAMIWLSFSNSLWMFYIFAIVFGFSFGGLSNLMASLIGDTFGVTNIGAITGVLVVGFTLGAAIGPALGGFIFDATGSYYVSFVVGIGAAIMAVLCMSLTKREAKANPNMAS